MLNSKKWVIWLVGEQLAGKTMFSTTLQSFGARILQIGERIRSNQDVMTFAAESNAYAAPSVEVMVQEMIRRELDEFKKDDSHLLIIDSAPKTMEQYNIMKAACDDFSSIVIILREKTEIRKARANTKYKGDLKLFNAREPNEQGWLNMFLRLCAIDQVQYIYLDRR